MPGCLSLTAPKQLLATELINDHPLGNQLPASKHPLRMETAKLSANDTNVLSALFDPELSLTSATQVENRWLDDQVPNRLRRLREQERLALQSVNLEQPQPVDIEHSISQLSEIIANEPSYASAWNNRAQARRMLIRDEDLPRNPCTVVEIFQDLAQAISLTTPTGPDVMLSDLDARVLASAHTHKGYLLLLASKSEDNRKLLAALPHLRDLSIQELEEAASRELGLGGRYGNETARQLAVKTNPYAKLCGSIVREALTKEISEFYQPHVSLAK